MCYRPASDVIRHDHETHAKVVRGSRTIHYRALYMLTVTVGLKVQEAPWPLADICQCALTASIVRRVYRRDGEKWISVRNFDVWSDDARSSFSGGDCMGKNCSQWTGAYDNFKARAIAAIPDQLALDRERFAGYLRDELSSSDVSTRVEPRS